MGLAGSMDLYTQQMKALASNGYVVCAVEHEEGSAMNAISSDGEQISYVDVGDWTELMDRTKMVKSRVTQLEKRCSELSHTLHMLPSVLFDSPLEEIVDFDDLSLIGHSFGAATLVKFLHENPNNVPIR